MSLKKKKQQKIQKMMENILFPIPYIKSTPLLDEIIRPSSTKRQEVNLKILKKEEDLKLSLRKVIFEYIEYKKSKPVFKKPLILKELS